MSISSINLFLFCLNLYFVVGVDTFTNLIECKDSILDSVQISEFSISSQLYHILRFFLTFYYAFHRWFDSACKCFFFVLFRLLCVCFLHFYEFLLSCYVCYYVRFINRIKKECSAHSRVFYNVLFARVSKPFYMLHHNCIT